MGLLADFKSYLAEKLDIHFTSNGRSRRQTFKFKNKVKAKGNATVEQNILLINLPQAKPEEQKQMLEELAESFNKGELVFVDDETKKLADGVTAAESSTESGELVKYFEGKLSQTDWQIFRTGLYTNYLIEQGMPTSEIRESVIRTYGFRGRNILNLASSGHFASHIKPLYEELSKAPDFTNVIFYEEFERILREMPFAIFVNSATDRERLHEMISERVEQAKHYSVEKQKLYIHGWGAHVKTIEACLELLEPSLKVTVNKRRQVVEVIDVTIEF